MNPNETTPNSKKVIRSYKRDETGHLMCDKCTFKPKPTTKYPKGNPGTLHYHMKSKHEGDFAHVCSICQHGFLHKMTLDTHMAARHPEHQDKKDIKTYACPVDGCEFEALTKSNRRIHFLRKHCHDSVLKYLEESVENTTRQYKCKCCQTVMNSNTAFHYHIAQCLVSHNIDVHPHLASVC